MDFVGAEANDWTFRGDQYEILACEDIPLPYFLCISSNLKNSFPPQMAFQ